MIVKVDITTSIYWFITAHFPHQHLQTALGYYVSNKSLR